MSRRTKPLRTTRTVPEQGALKLTPNAAYVHYTPNETIGGVEFPYIPQTGSVPLVADMSSNILSRPIDVSKFGVIYASAQKNIGPSGLAVVIVREDLLGRARPDHAVRARLQGDGGERLHVEHAADLRLVSRGPRLQVAEGATAASRGSPSATARRPRSSTTPSIRPASTRIPVAKNCRSWMNVPFTLAKPELDKTVPHRGEGRGAHESRRPSLRRRHARQHLQRDAAGRRRCAHRFHEGVPAPPRLMPRGATVPCVTES